MQYSVSLVLVLLRVLTACVKRRELYISRDFTASLSTQTPANTTVARSLLSRSITLTSLPLLLSNKHHFMNPADNKQRLGAAYSIPPVNATEQIASVLHFEILFGSTAV